MKIEILGKNCVKISLNVSELSNYGLSWEGLSTENIGTRRLIDELCIIASNETDFNREGRQLYVKAIPDFEGGCTFFLTLGGEDKNELYPVIYIAKDSENMMLAANKLSEIGLGDNTSVYFNNAKGYIFIQERENRQRAAQLILSEYCTADGRGSIAKARITESSKLICESSSELIRRINSNNRA